ncbi:Gfo/Idh/MocA family oxidoreductase [Blautia schinkii]|nr:Gfo/Idh/MocA family oxidoreductase [Blautia schinkii]
MIDGKLAICVIGAGRAGMIHARNYAKNVPGAMIAAVSDPVEETARAGAEELGCKYYLSEDQALENDKIDAYVVVSPTKFHVDIVKKLAAAKKHIFCEKPMAMTVDECDEMIKACQGNKVKLQIGFMRRFDEGFCQAKQIIEAGEIGDVVMVHSNTRGPSVPRPWMYDIHKSNGPLAEVNSHDIDTMRWFTGSEFKSVYAIGGNYRCSEAKEEWPDFYDNVVMSAEFENGMQGMLDGAQGVGYGYDAKVEILGTKGIIQLGGMQGQRLVTMKASNNSGIYPLVNSWRDLFKDAYLNEDVSFADAVLNDKPVKVTGHDGKMAVQVVNAGNISIVEKRIVRL